MFVGVLFGLSGFTFRYGEGLSYFSSDPRACANCHIMNEPLRSWGRSSHHAAAVCVDCHLPDPLVRKLLAKADNGWNHSSAFTLGGFHEPIQLKPRSARILQENCVRCHGDLVHSLVATARADEREGRCVHCHSHVGHGSRR